jgi:hypothetical protein
MPLTSHLIVFVGRRNAVLMLLGRVDVPVAVLFTPFFWRR